LAEICLRKGLNASAFIGREFNGYTVGDEMASGVQVYLDYVRKQLNPGAILMVEHKFVLDWIDPQAFGTGDAGVAIPYDTIEVIDLKYGYGVVEAVGNEQLLYYGLGMARTGDYQYVKLTIVQPRAPHKEGPVRTWTISVEDLVAWEAKLKAAIAETRVPNPRFKAGDHCKYCPARLICKVREERLAEIVPNMFEDISSEPNTTLPTAESLTPERLQYILDAIPEVQDWIKRIEAYAEAQALSGVKINGRKLVRGRTTKKWTDVEAAASVLQEKFGDEIFTDPELLSPAQINKRFGKAAKDLVETLVSKAEGKLTLVSEDDPRPEVDQQQVIADMFDTL
jgi:hypothetical protein